MGNYSPTEPRADEDVLVIVACEGGGLPRYGGVGCPMAVPPAGSPMPCSKEEFERICEAVDPLAEYRTLPVKCCKPKLGLQVERDLAAQYPHLRITCTTKWTQFRRGWTWGERMYWEYAFHIRRGDAAVIGKAAAAEDEAGEHDIHQTKQSEEDSTGPGGKHPGNRPRELLGPCTTAQVADRRNCLNLLAPLCRA